MFKWLSWVATYVPLDYFTGICFSTNQKLKATG